MMNNFNERFKELVRSTGKQLIQISEELKISKQKLSHWQTGYCEPCIDDLIIVAHYFNVSIDYLVGYEQEDGTKISITKY